MSELLFVQSLFIFVQFRCSVSSGGLEYAQDVDEEIDDVQVEFNRGHNVLLRGHFGHNELSVNNDEETKHTCTAHTHHQLKRVGLEVELKRHDEVNFWITSKILIPYGT